MSSARSKWIGDAWHNDASQKSAATLVPIMVDVRALGTSNGGLSKCEIDRW